jgi:transcriptional regulator with XRE-family HTH domain
MSTPQPKQVPEDVALVAAAVKSVLENLTPEQIEARKARRRAARESRDRKYVASKTAKEERQRQIFLRLLNGLNQEEVARSIGIPSKRVSDSISQIWPFSPPGAERRYLAVRISVPDLATLKEIAERMGLTIHQAAEQLFHAVLEEGGLVARRTLHVRSEP